MNDILAELDTARAALDRVEQAAVDASVTAAAQITALTADLVTATSQYAALQEAHEALKVAYERLLHPVQDTVHVGASRGVQQTMIGWTSVHDQRRDAMTRALLHEVSAVNNQHMIGFGANVDPQPGAGKPYNWSFLDATFGTPNASQSGYFSDGRKKVLTLCGWPPHMRSPKPGTTWDPMGPRTGDDLTRLDRYTFPHSSWWSEAADLVAAAVARYKPYAVQLHNEGKMCYIGTVHPGSNISPAGSGLPAISGGNRWWTEGLVGFGNVLFPKIKAANAATKFASPYLVYRSYMNDTPGDWADDAFPYHLQGTWGKADKKPLQTIMYTLEHSVGLDLLCIDVKTSTNDTDTMKPEYQWDGGQRLIDFHTWLRQLYVHNPAKYWRAETVQTCYGECYFRIDGPLTGRHQEAAATDAWGIVNYIYGTDCDYALRWKPEGRAEAPDNDTAFSNTIGVWHEYGSADSLEPTEAYPVYKGLLEHFPPGTPLFEVETGDPFVTGVASDSMVCLISRYPLPVEVVFNHQPLTIPAYGVEFVQRGTA